MNTSIIVAVDKNGGISKDGVIPWHIKEDVQFFMDVTKRSYNGLKNVLIMGKNTWLVCRDTLKDRYIIVVSSTLVIDNLHTYLASNFKDALNNANLMFDEGIIGHIFICGGSKIYTEAQQYHINTILFNKPLSKDYECDNRVNLGFLNPDS